MSSNSILIKVPSKPDYISMVRLSSSSVAYNLGLDVNEIEDIKVCIGEACANAFSLNEDANITVKFIIHDDKFEINISGVVEEIPEGIEQGKERELGVLIIKSLMDEVKFTNEGIIMSKYI